MKHLAVMKIKMKHENTASLRVVGNCMYEDKTSSHVYVVSTVTF